MTTISLPPVGGRFIYRPYITLKDGTKLWAKSKGKRAFRIPIEDDVDDKTED